MGEACCTHGEDEEFVPILVRKPEIKGRTHSKDLNINGKTILKLISNRACICVYSWVQAAQDGRRTRGTHLWSWKLNVNFIKFSTNTRG